ncbi:MAG: bifunctional diaminohydroxyphosphoribosylaminopyrimidine deaminase/5-amino-6-(5-phosphoribosylamino)uracil reductase RibD [Bacteroidales bacterium]|nr:bifunctional diaminohydroxyphosphoribosylaminopyrimidine deaminase/5-amino-6-(5-phosphoribosylamino)uracil reductase RibD [Bacteroidales bacterium]
MTADETFMQRCLQLAASGLGAVQPNPMVGAVIVHQGLIIGEGYHHAYGEAHAEVNAIASVKDPSLLSSSTLYVNLEPCSHYGKTPPCADAIIRHRIPRVVVGTQDYHSKVNGSGIRKLQEAGVEVVLPVCETACLELNRRFFTYHRKQRPYIILKWAQTQDGFMDIDRSDATQPHDYWITNPALKVITHQWRSEEDAILVGWNTMHNDHPQLTTRLYPGKDPKRFVMQRGDSLISELPYTPLPPDIPSALQILYEQKIQSVIIEGGRKTLERFINEDLWDEARVLVGDITFGKGLRAPALPAPPHRVETVNQNQILYVRRHL